MNESNEITHDHALLSKILETSVSAITVVNTDGAIEFANGAAKEILGLVPSEIAGKTFNDPQWAITTYDGEVFPNDELPFQRVVTTGKPVYGVQHAIQWPDGTRRFLSINGAPLFDEEGALKQVVFSISDVTEQKEMEEELRLSERRFRDVAEASGEYIWELDAQGKYTYASRRFGEMLERPVDEMMGKSPFDFMPPDEAERVGALFDEIQRNQQHFTGLEHRSVLPNGGFIWQRVSGLPVFNATGTFIGYRGTAANITERKESEAALKESAERLELAIAASGLGIWDLEIATGRLTWDDSMLAIYGIAREEFTSAYEVWEYALLPEDRSKAETALKDAIREHKAFDLQFRIERPDGQIRTIHAIARVYFRDDGRPERLVGINMDITERIRSEEALRENEAKLSGLYNLAPVAIVLNRKSDGKFMEANPELFRLTGYSEEEYRELTYFDITPEKYAEDEEAQLKELEQRGYYGPFEKEYIRKDGSLVPVLLRGVMITTADGEEMIWSIIQDISAQKRHERELQQAKEEAESANRAKSEFLANMSHEIRTPMNAVIGLSQLLLNTEMRTDQEDKLNKIHQSSRMLLGIINDILDFSKIESGKLELEVTAFRIRDVVDQLATLFYDAMDTKDLELFFHVSPDVPATLSGDSLRIGQVLTNLLSNALKFTHQGAVKLFVHQTEQTERGVVLQFEVKDTGIGIDQEQLGRLFTPFSQADASTTRKYGGTGLGLVISSRIVEAMGGTLEVESTLGVGSVFRFKLELAISGEQSLPSLDRFWERKRILVVDDSEDARLILEEILESYNMQVEVAAGGEEAIDKVLRADKVGEPYEIILMDWKMPGLNGLEASRKIRALANSGDLQRKTPSILMVSAYNMEDIGIEEGEEIDFVPKPVTASSLFEALRRAVSGETSDRSSVLAQQSARIEAPVFSGLQVLLVEDNELNQEVAYNLLIRTQADVDIAQNGVEAVSMVQERSYDMIFMDLQMPAMDGYEATRIIKKDQPKIPIIALTAGAMQEDRKKAQEAGLDEHLTKPINTNELYRTMKRYAPSGSIATDEDTGSGTAKRSATPQSPSVPADVPGFDIPAGIEISGDNPDFYVKMLYKYEGHLQKLYTDAIHAVEDLPRDADTTNREFVEPAAAAVHTLKGMAGNMAAVSLQTAAAELEKQIKSGHTPERAAISALKDAYEETATGLARLKTLRTSITEESGGSIESIESPSPPAKDIDFTYAWEVCSRLEAGEMLSDDEVQKLLDTLRGTIRDGERETLFRLIDDLMYNEAAEALINILNKTKGR